MTIGSLAVNVVARTGALVRGLTKSRSLVKSFAMATGVSMATVAGAVAGAMTSYEGLNQAMTNSLAIMGNVSDSMRSSMTQSVIDMSGDTKFAAVELGNALRSIASAGYSAEESMAVLPVVARFAQAGNFDLAVATNLAADAQAALGLKSKDLAENLKNITRVTDVLTAAEIASNATTEEFSLALTNKAAAAARLVGHDIEQVTAVLAAFAQQGIKGENAGDAFNIVMRDMQTKALENVKAFKAARVAVFDSTGEMRNMADIVQDLERLLNGLSDEQKKSTLLQLGFTDKSIAFTQALLGTSDQIRDYEQQLRRANGINKEVADKSLTDLQKSLNRTREAWNRMGTAAGEAANRVGLFTGMSEGMEGGALLMEHATQTGSAVGEKTDILNTLTSDFNGGKGWLREFFEERFKPYMPTEAKGKTAGEMQDLIDRTTKYQGTRENVFGEKSYQATNTIDMVAGKAFAAINDGLTTVKSQALAANVNLVTFVDKAKEGMADLQIAGLKFSLVDAPRNMQKAAEEAAKKAGEVMKQQQREQAMAAREAQSLMESVMTPLERTQAKVREAMGMYVRGLIDDQTMQRVIAAQSRSLAGATPKYASLSEIQSEDRLSAGRGRDKGPMEEIAKNAKDQLAVMKDIRDGKGAKGKPAFTGDINVRMHTIA